jgi:hypothetical protein
MRARKRRRRRKRIDLVFMDCVLAINGVKLGARLVK